MASKQRHPLLQYLHKLTGGTSVRELTDRQLLERFASERDETAFDLLVQRHGPMIWGVCRRILGQDTDADDAFQATFLVLARKAATLRWPESVGSWLYGVAHRVALKARVQSARRNEREKRATREPPSDPLAEITGRELQQVVDEELLQLPDRYRAPLVLCYLEGKTRDEAAELLGWTVGSVKGRLERGRLLLEKRLSRRGLAFSTALLAALLAKSSAAATVPAALKAAVIEAASAGQSAGVSASALALAESVLRTLFLARVKMVLAAALAIGVLGTGAGVALRNSGKAAAVAQTPDAEIAATSAPEPAPLVGPPALAREPITVPKVGDGDGKAPSTSGQGDERKPLLNLRAPVRRVDLANRTITFAHREQPERDRVDRTLPLAPDAEIQLLDDWGVEGKQGSRAGRLADLSEGSMVQLHLAPDEQTIVRVRAEPLTLRGQLVAVDAAAGDLSDCPKINPQFLE